MTSQDIPARTPDHRAAGPSEAQAVTAALVEAGLVAPERRADAERVVGDSLHATAAPAAFPLRRRMSEIAGYVGGAFVVGAAVLFFGNQWEDLTRGGRIGLLAGIALVLGLVAGGVVLTGGGPAAVRAPAQDVRRRLASVLSAGAAVAAGFAAGLATQDPDTFSDDSRGVLVGALVAIAVALAGYLGAPSAVGQGVMAVASFMVVTSGLDVVGDVDPTVAGLLVLAVGLGWLALAETGVWHEPVVARVVGSAMALVGAQMPLGADSPWPAYLLTALVSAAAFTAYVLRQAWPYLAVGVAAATIVVPEALSDWTEGSMGSAGVLLVTGVTLLLASLAGLRLRQEIGEEHGESDDQPGEPMGERPPGRWGGRLRHG